MTKKNNFRAGVLYDAYFKEFAEMQVEVQKLQKMGHVIEEHMQKYVSNEGGNIEIEKDEYEEGEDEDRVDEDCKDNRECIFMTEKRKLFDRYKLAVILLEWEFQRCRNEWEFFTF